MSQVFDSLVQRFLNVERYSDDVRYVNYCIKYVSLAEMLHHSSQQTRHMVFTSLHMHHLLPHRRVSTQTPLPCTPIFTVKEWVTGRAPSTWPGRSSWSSGGCLSRQTPSTRKLWRTKPSLLTQSSMSTGGTLGEYSKLYLIILVRGSVELLSHTPNAGSGRPAVVFKLKWFYFL